MAAHPIRYSSGVARRVKHMRPRCATNTPGATGSSPGSCGSGGNVDTKSRYIYIHGTPDDTDMSRPGSHGCVRMRNADITELYDLVPPGTVVDIT